MKIVWEVYVHNGLEPLNMQESANENGAIVAPPDALGPCFATRDQADRFCGWVRATVSRTSPDATVCVLSHEIRQ